ncbi:hypothetical protein GGS24DRAFT_288618 [Hypoxylon argillaceum]|nr:hypothetical protein GGS24DRAFT_288618 [Hypoxylon argillaceum]KAI1147277.1 hypothetical protein F4825DRAFT_437967 [Nemania diffusa]
MAESNITDAWTTVEYKKHISKKISAARARGRGYGGKGFTIKQKTTMGTTNPAITKQKISIEEKIQGPLPGWYRPPAWDVRPSHRKLNTKK